MVLQYIGKAYSSLFGSRNTRLVRAYQRRVEMVNELEQQMLPLTDDELRAKTQEFRKRIGNGERAGDLAIEALATSREVMDRAVGIRSALNPELAERFPTDKLPADMRKVYERLKAEAAALPPVEEPGCEVPVPGWMQVRIPPEFYAAVREIFPESRPPFRARPFDVQLIGGMVLGEGNIAEMKTGEGKTIVAPLACYIACLEGLHCHVITVNDYLVQRDRDWVFPFYYWLGLTVGAIHPSHMQRPQQKQQAYVCDVAYGTNSEFGFDYLRDNMKLSVEEQVQKHRDFVIIDEVDSILIDEARTPLIISGPAHDDAPRYELADKLARHLMEKQQEWTKADVKVQQTIMRIKGLEGDVRQARDKADIPKMREEMKRLQEQLPALEAARDQYTQYYEVEREKKATHLTHDGVGEAQRVAGVGSFYVGNNMDIPHLLENALRAHVIYLRDKEYVVRDDEIIIVDEFTGRLMVGRQWSDGLHQAVECKEGVRIKQETQTMATVTIQNFLKLYKRRAGMTGTAITEATEFREIYHVDVVCIPTNVPVVRKDYNDLVFLAEKDKWAAVLENIKDVHDVGRPVLVGTTSVEKSQMLADRLSRKHGLKHEVLNAKQHEREANIVENAGQLGAVMIATNMAGRGTDIKLGQITREALISHWQRRNLLPRDVKATEDDEAIIGKVYRTLARNELKMSAADVDAMTDSDARLTLMRHWVTQYAYVEPKKAPGMSAEACEALLDQVPDFMLHRLRMFKSVEEMGGLHIVGTERHESRRIDNQLRGRAGRQGDRGSSRFLISLEDDLMKMFAGKGTLAILSKLGMKEGDAIEHRMITSSVERAQRKVEERNYEVRKNLIEYDEVMEHQRQAFYGIRQEVLEGRQIDELIFNYIGDSAEDAVRTYLSRDYVPEQVAAWCREAFGVHVEAHKLRASDLDDLQELVREQVREEIQQTVGVTLGEYLSNDMLPEDWDVLGVSQWAKSQFDVDLPAGDLRQMNVDEIRQQLIDAANERVEQKDLSELAKFIDPLFGAKALADWADQKFSMKLDTESIAPKESERPAETTARVTEAIIDDARKLYDKRRLEYPIEFTMELAFRAAKQDQDWAVTQLIGWAKQRYELDWSPEEVIQWQGAEIRTRLQAAAEPWVFGDKAEQLADAAIREHKTAEALAQWTRSRLGVRSEPADFEGDADKRQVLIDKVHQMLRTELTQLERFVLLQILDTAWKDHLYAMDQLRDSVRLRAYSEKDPRIEYKREGSHAFDMMQQNVRDRVTELIFRARLTPEVQLRNVYEDQQAQHAEAPSVAAMAAATAEQGTAQQQADLDAADHAGQPAADEQPTGDGDDEHRDAVKRAQRQRDRRKRSR